MCQESSEKKLVLLSIFIHQWEVGPMWSQHSLQYKKPQVHYNNNCRKHLKQNFACHARLGWAHRHMLLLAEHRLHCSVCGSHCSAHTASELPIPHLRTFLLNKTFINLADAPILHLSLLNIFMGIPPYGGASMG